MNGIVFVLFVLIYCVLYSNGRSENFDVIVESVLHCRNPQPPLSKEPAIVSTFNIQRRKEKAYITGQHVVVDNVPFLNFSISSYSLADGREHLQAMFENLSCHSWVSRAYLTFSKFRYNKKDCRLRKGTYGYNDIDMNTILHTLPNYHEKGIVLHKLMLVYNGSTVFCHELKLTVKDIKTVN